jgi:hypothetical protein
MYVLCYRINRSDWNGPSFKPCIEGPFEDFETAKLIGMKRLGKDTQSSGSTRIISEVTSFTIYQLGGSATFQSEVTRVENFAGTSSG